MAIEYISEALKLQLPSGQKFVLIAIANRANEDGLCWPSHNDISRQTGISKRSVVRYLQWLEEKGYITRSKRLRPDGSRSSDNIRITLGGSDTVALGSDRLSLGSDTVAGGVVTRWQGGSDTVALHETSIEPSYETSEKGRASPSPAKPRKETRLPEDWKVNEKLREWAAKLDVPSSKLEWETEKFRDYWQAQAGSKAIKRDWDSAWRTWIRRALEDIKVKPPLKKGAGRTVNQIHEELFN